MQSLPDSRAQTYEELYGPPENFLEIEVRSQKKTPAPTATFPESSEIPCRTAQHLCPYPETFPIPPTANPSPPALPH